MLEYTVGCIGEIQGVKYIANFAAVQQDQVIINCSEFVGIEGPVIDGTEWRYYVGSDSFVFDTFTGAASPWPMGFHDGYGVDTSNIMGGFSIAFIAVLSVCFIAAVLGWLLGLFNKDM